MTHINEIEGIGPSRAEKLESSWHQNGGGSLEGRRNREIAAKNSSRKPEFHII
jgi:hypothetical protein